MYNKVPTDLNFVSREREVARLWKEKDVIHKSFDLRKDGERLSPSSTARPRPTASPISGTSETRVHQRPIPPLLRPCRAITSPRKAGWDTHGLPVELEVEKILGLDGKPQIEEYGIEPFIEQVQGERMEIQKRMGDR